MALYTQRVHDISLKNREVSVRNSSLSLDWTRGERRVCLSRWSLGELFLMRSRSDGICCGASFLFWASFVTSLVRSSCGGMLFASWALLFPLSTVFIHLPHFEVDNHFNGLWCVSVSEHVAYCLLSNGTLWCLLTLRSFWPRTKISFVHSAIVH